MNEAFLGLKETDIDSIREELDRLKIRVSNLSASRDVGNVLGGMIRTEIAPGLLPIGPYREDVDSTHALEFTLWISEEILRIRKMTLHLTPKASRIAAGVTAASADTIPVESAGHVHLWSQWVSNTPLTTGNTVVTGITSVGAPSPTTNVAGSPHTHVETGVSTQADTATVAVGSSTHVHAVNVSTALGVLVGNLTKWGTYDSTGAVGATYQFDMIPVAGHANGFYTAISADATTAVSTPDHTHDVDLAISEHGMADDLAIIIDGVDQTANLGGPWTSTSDIVINPGDLIIVGFVNAKMEVATGPHTIKITSSAEGAVEVVGDYSVIIKAVQ